MTAPLAAKPTCANCGAPMDQVYTVAVLASLEGHSIFECEWCGRITLITNGERPPSANWFGSVPLERQCGVYYTPLLRRA